MTAPRRLQTDHVGGALLALMGIAIVVLGLNYRMNTLVRMGAGFIPVVLGVIMTVVGICVALLADRDAPPEQEKGAIRTRHFALPEPPDLRGAVCILGGVAAFVVFAAYGGLIPAAFASVFVAALGDRDNTWKTAAAIGAAMSVFGVLVFHYGLRVQMPLLSWVS